MMSLNIGDRIGSYEILSLIGVGGMGEVYKAKDRKLGRSVAIKVLPAEVAQDPDRLARFRREAQLLASLNHPNIAAIHGLEEEAGQPFLVLELVEGEDLNERLKRSGMPLDETLEIAKQIAEALEEAHEKGVVHRDLKPANVKLTAGGRVKVLDFGLAKAFDTHPHASASPAVSTPTMTRHTAAGVILGTAEYMSPEQARGGSVDKRSDIWSFGVVLIEMLTGQSTFRRKSLADTLSAILSDSPGWDEIPAEVPFNVRRMLARCLSKNVERRLRDIGDARIELEEALVELRGPTSGALVSGVFPPAPTATPSPTPRGRRWPWALVGWVTGVAVAGLVGWSLVRGNIATDGRTSPVRFSIPSTREAVFGEFIADPYPAVSPDGSSLAYVATTEGAPNQLWIRPLDSFTASPVAGAIEVQWPFWSPDGRYLAYFSRGQLMKADASGGPSQALCDAKALGGAWSPKGVIIFGTDRGMMRIPPEGGSPQLIAELSPEHEVLSQRFPSFLPDGHRFIYLQVSRKPEHSGIYMGSLDGGPGRRLLPEISNAAWSRGHVLFVRGRSLMAQPVDSDGFALSGDPTVLATPLDVLGSVNYAPFSVAGDTLVYRPAANPTTELVLVGRDGKRIRRVGTPGFHLSPSFSPDGSKIAVARWDPNTNGYNLWQIDLRLDSAVRLTSGAWFDGQPIWSPDGRRLVYASTRSGTFNIYEKDFSGTGMDSVLYQTGARIFPHCWSRDGRLVYTEEDGSGPEGDIWILSLATSEAKPLFRTDADETQGRISPDGRWIAFASDESGRWEIYVRSLDPGGIRKLVSSNGGTNPLWRADSRELFYSEPDDRTRSSLAIDQTLMSVAVRADHDITLGTPRPLFSARTPTFSLYETWAYSVTGDGQTFVVNQILEETEAPLQVALGWTEWLDR